MLNKNRSDSLEELQKLYEDEFRLPWVRGVDGWAMHRYDKFIEWMFMSVDESNRRLRDAIASSNALKASGITLN